jgi:hypothetical protein
VIDVAEDKGGLRDEEDQPAREDHRVKVDDGRERGRARHDFRYVGVKETGDDRHRSDDRHETEETMIAWPRLECARGRSAALRRRSR